MPIYNDAQMSQPMGYQNVPVAPVDTNFQIPTMQNPGMMQQTQIPPQLQHINDVLNEYMNSKARQSNNGGITEQILANRFQPTMQDISTAGLREAQSYAQKPGGFAVDPSQVMAQRYESELSPYTSMLSNQMRAGTQYMNMSGGGTGVLINRLMQENPGLTFQDALYAVQSGMKQNLQMGPNGAVTPIQGAPEAAGQMSFGKQAGEQAANLQYAAPIATAKTGAEESQKAQYAAPIAQATEMGKNRAENQQTGLATNDIIGLYGKLQNDAKSAPSGVVESTIARAANAANMPTQGSVAQATFDADLNNLYLATIRSLKGTGRVMEQELNKIAESAPKSTDSMPVKIAKAQAHMDYYTQRMRSLGFDPTSGQPVNQTGIPPVNSSQLNMPGSGGTPNPPTPGQIQQQMQGGQADPLGIR